MKRGIKRQKIGGNEDWVRMLSENLKENQKIFRKEAKSIKKDEEKLSQFKGIRTGTKE